MDDLVSFSIRPARRDEIEALRQIELDAFFALRDAGGIPGEPSATSADSLFVMLENGLLVVAANSEDRPLGFLGATQIGDELYINEIDVLRAVQGKGLGKALIVWAVEEMGRRRLRRATLTTDRFVPFNAPFYARKGFRVLADDELSSHLQRALDHQIKCGLDPARRVAMAWDNH
jgi:GNAT superfamily N-acetyltransferase